MYRPLERSRTAIRSSWNAEEGSSCRLLRSTADCAAAAAAEAWAASADAPEADGVAGVAGPAEVAGPVGVAGPAEVAGPAGVADPAEVGGVDEAPSADGAPAADDAGAGDTGTGVGDADAGDAAAGDGGALAADSAGAGEAAVAPSPGSASDALGPPLCPFASAFQSSGVPSAEDARNTISSTWYTGASGICGEMEGPSIGAAGLAGCCASVGMLSREASAAKTGLITFSTGSWGCRDVASLH